VLLYMQKKWKLWWWKKKVYARSVFIIILVIWVISMMAFLTAEAKRHFKRYNKDVQVEYFFLYYPTYSHSPSLTISSLLTFCTRHCVSFSVCEYEKNNREGKKILRRTYTQKKGTYSTSILLCLCLWYHFDYFILVQHIKINSYSEINENIHTKKMATLIFVSSFVPFVVARLWCFLMNDMLIFMLNY